MKHRVTKEIDFCYGHRLRDYEGKCRYLHGHNGRLEITFVAETLDERGMVFDFGDIKDLVKSWVDEKMDHKMLLRRDDPMVETLLAAGEPLFLMDDNPTAENIAKAVFEYVESEGYPVERVRLWETPTSWAEFARS